METQFKQELLDLLARHNAALRAEDNFYEGMRIIAVLNGDNIDLGNFVGLDNLK